jgi:hypothetical protein
LRASGLRKASRLSADVRFRERWPIAFYIAPVKFELAAIDAGHDPYPNLGLEAAPGNARPAPLAAKLEIDPWITSEFTVSIEASRPLNKAVFQIDGAFEPNAAVVGCCISSIP